VGARFTSYFGSQQFFSSAPASLAADPAKVDSLLVASAQLNSLNLAIHVGYRLTGKINLGFNIDATGFSLGPKQNTDFRMNKSSSSVSSQPTPFNILLVGYNDRGMLNSEFFARYFFNDRWAIKVAYQHLFTEYTTGTKIQQQPEANDRFRNTSDMFSIGVSRVF
jgi:long-subunit fatty acid transport protein